MKNTFLKFLFIVFIGILVALFVGVGIDTFYSMPERPVYPQVERPIDPVKAPLPEEDIVKNQAEQVEYQKKYDEYRDDAKAYNRNVFIIATIAAVIIVVLSLIFLKALSFIADGLLLGGILSLFYAVVRAFQSDNSVLRFIAVAISLAVVLAVAYFRFIKKEEK